MARETASAGSPRAAGNEGSCSSSSIHRSSIRPVNSRARAGAQSRSETGAGRSTGDQPTHMLSLVRLLITGGSGYLGGELVRRAPAAGWDATGTRFASPGDGPVLDVRHADAVERLVGALGPAAVVHTAY